MRIELGTGPENIQVSKSDLRKLTQQMANLLADLKMTLGKPVMVDITESSAITKEERVALILQLKKQPQQAALVEILRKPATKLLTLALHNRQAHVITDLPLKVGQTLLIKANSNSLATVTALPQPTPLSTTGVPKSLTATAELHSTGFSLTYTKAHSTEPNKMLERQGRGAQGLLALGSTSKLQRDPSSLIAQTNLQKSTSPGPLQTKGESLSSSSVTSPSAASSGETSKSGMTTAAGKLSPAFPIEQLAPAAQTLVKQLLRTNLPLAEPVAKVLTQMERLAPLPTKTIKTHIHTLRADKTHGQAVLQLLKALTKLATMPLPLNPGKPPSSNSLMQTFANSGVFLETKLRQQLGRAADGELDKIKGQDLKAVLLQVQNATGPLLNTLVAVKPATPATDALAKILLGMLQGPDPSEAQSKNPRHEASELLRQVENLAKRALAQIELRQIQSLRPPLSEPSTNPAMVNLEVPLRLPDGLVNLFISFFEPETNKDKNKKKKKEELARRSWKLFLKLDLEDSGELAAELSLMNKSIDATIWADRDDLRQVARAGLEKLRTDLAQQGLDVGNLNCSDELPPSPPNRNPGPLVDIET